MTDKPTTRRALGFGLLGALSLIPVALAPSAARADDDDEGRRWGRNPPGYGRGPWYDPRYDARYESWREAHEMERRRIRVRHRRDNDHDDDDDHRRRRHQRREDD
jgi:hypothetical protein